MNADGEERFRSGKALAAALLLAGVLAAAAAVFLVVVFERACRERRPATAAPIRPAGRGGASI